MPEHIHRLKRHIYPNGTKVYFCTNDCTFKVDVAFALGKKVLCNICNNEFIMNEYSVKLAKPHCTNCGKMRIKTADGKGKFISKNSPTESIADLGKSAVSSLKQRLGSVTIMEKDEDL